MIQSRFLTELEKAASITKDRIAWSRANCQIAMHHARQGDPETAIKFIAKVRAHYGVNLHHVVASWVMLAEGVIHFSKAEMKQAYDRIRRAYGLAVALRTESARPACAAWMALIEFNAGKYDEMLTHVDEALTEANDKDHQARGRACLVLADALQMAGTYELARPWYESTRRHATAEGDQATLGAMLYNVAVFRTSKLILNDVFDQVDSADLKRASMEAHSSFSYDMAVGAVPFSSLWKILHGQLLLLQGEYSEAMILLNAIRIEELVPRDVPIVLADTAWCNLSLDRRDTAIHFVNRAKECIGNLSDRDDLAYVLARLSKTYRALGDFAIADDLLANANNHLAAHREFQAMLMDKLETVRKKHADEEKRPGASRV